MRGLRRHVTYANVTATLALFVALSAGAYALSRNDVKSKHIAPGAVKLSDTNDKLRLKCPGGTVLVEGACLEREARGTNEWPVAVSTCVDAGRRLPSPAELISGRNEPRVGALHEDSEWTDDLAGSSPTRVTVIAETGGYASSEDGVDRGYRCVAAPKR